MAEPLKMSKDHVALIQQMAIDRWGEEITRYGTPKWQAELVNAYCEVLQSQGDLTAKPLNRRSQVLRVLLDEEKKGGCNADTLICLYAAVNCRLDVVKLERFVL
jgi:hypothetical protein